MDRQHAQRIIKETFENPFERGRFSGFIKNLLNRIEDAPFTYQGNFIPDAYKPHVSSLERIGKYSDGEHKIDLLIVHLKKETSLERARAMQRNFIAWYLNGSRGGTLKDAALAAFVSPQKTDWRFSLVKMDYKFDENGKVKEEFTPARRWSFLVGSNEASHTAQSRLMPILTDDERNPTLKELEETFNIETVTKEFFLEYRNLFIRTKEALDRLVTQASSLGNEFNAKGVNTVDFAKKLLGQIVFLYFLQKKGWFGVERDAEWGSGSKHFLRELFKGKHGAYKNFFNDILEPLFYQALRLDRRHDDDYYDRFNCKIPFLNGGLFDPIGNYDWVHTDIILPNELFSNQAKTRQGDTGNGILDIFDRYNFTVKEDEPLEKEVAIDPELLGKAYEKFNAIRPDNFEEYKKALKSGKKGDEIKFNKQFGVYYTPREIVHYMCQQSLIQYLYNVTQASSLSSPGKEEEYSQDAGDTIPDDTIMYYDPDAPTEKKRRNLPHWQQEGTAYFVTFRLYDSIPKQVADDIRKQREQWLKTTGISDPSEVKKLDKHKQIEYYRLFSKRYDELLDSGYGSCVLAKPECKKIVEDALKYFNGERYDLDRYVVMPNHVHVIVMPKENWSLSQITHSWKSYTSNAINKVLGRQGQLWMAESFDHIIRSPLQLQKIRKYIEDNPKNVTQASSLSSTVSQASNLSNSGKEESRQDAGDTITHRQDARVTIEDLETLIKYGERMGEHEAAALLKEKSIAAGKQQTTTLKSELPESIRRNAERIDRALANITVCDPAVGSGAFPVGMMHEIVKTRQVLNVIQASSLNNNVTQASQPEQPGQGKHRQDARATYHFKRECIEKSLYGVDVDPGAVEIAKLRLWLSLVVEEDDYHTIQPLPNLDYKIVCGDSLSGLEGVLIDIPLEKKLEDLKQKFFSETRSREKENLRNEINQTLKEILASAGAYGRRASFDFRVFFSEVFHQKDAHSASSGPGFDVVIANPPYVRQEQIKEYKPLLKDVYQCYNGAADIYVYFYERGFNLLRRNGVLIFITSNKYMRAGYGEKLRHFLGNSATIIELIDFGDAPVFEATAYPSIILLQKSKPNIKGDHKGLQPLVKALSWQRETPLEEFEQVVHSGSFLIAQKELTADGWRIETPAALRLLEKLRKAGQPLGEYVQGRFYRGVLTGLNEAFVVDRPTRDRLIAEHPSSAEVLKPFLRGRDVKRWRVEPNDLWLIFTRRGIDIKKYPAIHDHLSKFKKSLTPGIPGGRKPGSYQWYEIQDNIAYWQEFEQPKIVYPDIATRCQFTLDTNNFYPDCTLFLIPNGSLTILGFLNSRLNEFFFSQISPKIRADFMRFKSIYVSRIPIATGSQTGQIERLVEQILTAKQKNPNADVSGLEREIDHLVYHLYGLGAEEIQIIKGEETHAR